MVYIRSDYRRRYFSFPSVGRQIRAHLRTDDGIDRPARGRRGGESLDEQESVSDDGWLHNFRRFLASSSRRASKAADSRSSQDPHSEIPDVQKAHPEKRAEIAQFEDEEESEICTYVRCV